MNNTVLIIIPAFNEAKSLPDLLSSLESYRDRYDVIVIDDGSHDDTAAVARKLGVTVIQLPENLGIGGAVQTGFKYAVQHDYEIVVQIDGDGQHDPAWLDNLISPIRRGKANCVVGSRYMKEHPDKNYKTPFLRRIGMIFSTSLLRLATGMTIYDTTSGFRALDRKVFTFFEHTYPVDHPEAETLLMLYRANFKIVEIPVTMFQRKAGTSLFDWYKVARYPFRVLIGFLELLLKSK
jgi:glycosyltransferase involved in cell wall biosynthesis